MQTGISVEVLNELDLKRERANAEAERHRRQRDALNTETREWVERRDALNAQVRALVEEATGHRQARDGKNAEVQERKAERDRWNRRVSELMAKANGLKRSKAPRGGGVPLSRLRREARDLEFRQQTTVLSPGDEKGLIDRLSRLEAEIRKREAEVEKDAEVSQAMKELREARDTAEATHRQVGELADAAQAEHDKMVSLFEQGDELRHEADLAQEEFLKTKAAADEEHRLHIEYIRQVHDLDKIIHGMRMRRAAAGAEPVKVGRHAAEAIFERFRKGEKLSTEDLLVLQKSGYT